MKRNEIQKLKEKNQTELVKDLVTLRDNLRSLKFDVNSGKLKNSNTIKEAKKEIARILTFLNQQKQ